jgi:hypothetical protein
LAVDVVDALTDVQRRAAMFAVTADREETNNQSLFSAPYPYATPSVPNIGVYINHTPPHIVEYLEEKDLYEIKLLHFGYSFFCGKLTYCYHYILYLTKFLWLDIKKMLFTNGGTCLFDIVHSALWGSEYPVCTLDTQVLFLTISGACMLHTQHSSVQAHPGGA